MSGTTVDIDGLAEAVSRAMADYRDVAIDGMKAAVQTTANAVRDEIRETAPKQTGAYAKSWAVKKTYETTDRMTCTVYSKTHAWLAHLLENGHAKRGGGRVAAQPHIAPAEEHGQEKLIEELERSLKNG